MEFGDTELRQLLHQLPGDQFTVANAELVFAYLRHGGDRETCMLCLTRLPVLRDRADDVLALCRPPLTSTKLACLRRYATANVEDLVYALRFTPSLAPAILRMLVHAAPPDDDQVVRAAAACLHHDAITATVAAEVLPTLATAGHIIDHLLVPYVPALATLVPTNPAAVHLLVHMIDRSVDAEEAVFDHALHAVVARGHSCAVSVRLVRAMSTPYPRAVVRCGGLTMLMRARGPAPSAITALYRRAAAPDENDNEVLAFMHCRMEMPPRTMEVMARHWTSWSPALKGIYAAAFDMALGPVARPPPPALPDFNVHHTGTVNLVPADGGEAITVLLAPLARASAFVDAHVRNDPGVALEVPLTERHLEGLVRALLYDEVPHDAETRAALAELGHMWCAPHLVHRCVAEMDIWTLIDMGAADWPEAQPLMRCHALENLVDMAAHARANELAVLAFQ